MNIVRSDLDGHGDEAGELDEQSLGLGALQLLQMALVVVQGSSDDAYLLADHRRLDLVGAVEAGSVCRLDGFLETFHVRVPDGHDDVLAAVDIAVLELGDAGNNGVEVSVGTADE